MSSVTVPLKKQIIFGFLALVIVLVALEGIVRFYELNNPDCTFLHKDAFDETGYFLTRTICNNFNTQLYEDWGVDTIKIPVNSPNQHSTTININSHGFRGEEISKQKLENVYRIFVIGGSTTFSAASTSDETTVPGYLQHKFDSENLSFKVEVINAGIPTADSFSETYLLKNKLIDFEPDLFIIFDGWNDAKHDVNMWTDLLKESDVKTDFEDETGSLFKFKNFPYYRTPFLIFDIFFSHDIYWNNYLIDETQTSQKVSLWENRWNEVCELGNQTGFDVIITVQPALGTGNKTLSPDETNLAPYLDEHFAIHRVMEDMVYSLNNLEKNCKKTVDLRNVFDGISEPVFYDPIHTNSFGNRIIAEKIFELSLPVVLDKN